MARRVGCLGWILRRMPLVGPVAVALGGCGDGGATPIGDSWYLGAIATILAVGVAVLGGIYFEFRHTQREGRRERRDERRDERRP